MAAIESWDEDVDFQGDFQAFAGTSLGTVGHASVSSRLSVHSESLAGDDDWNVVLQPDDEHSTNHAIQQAKQAGIPLPAGVPSSALLGGTIKRLGKANSRQKLTEDWDNDLEMPDSGGLTLKPKPKDPDPTEEEFDDFDDLEGSLGIRFAGTKRDARSGSVSGMSPSAGSVTAESEEDELRGLELPEEPLDFKALLNKRRAAEAELSDLSQAGTAEHSPAIEQPATLNVHKKSKLLAEDNDDYLNDFELGGGDILENKKTRFNKNVKLKSMKPAVPTAQRSATTLNFHDKPTDKPMHTRSHLPRPVSSRPPRALLDPVYETGASQVQRERRQPTTTSAQLLRSKRSMPLLGSSRSNMPSNKPTNPLYLPALRDNQPSPAQRAMPYHLRRDSDPNRRGAQSPPARPSSRLSNAYVPETPSRSGKLPRKDLAPAALAREAAAKRTLTRPARKRNYGDGSELEIFDDLPTSTTKEQKFVKEPVGRGPPRPALRLTQSRADMRDPVKRAVPDRMTTPAPPRTPASPTKGFHQHQHSTPSYMRDTAASRIARETLPRNAPRPRSEGPLQPLATNWKAQIAARTPFASPSASRQKPKRQPALITAMNQSQLKSANDKGMVYNAKTQTWEGNENAMAHFEFPPPLQTPTPTGHHSHQRQNSYMGIADRQVQSSPPRATPALIAPMQTTVGVQVNGGMVFDPRQMKWLKLKDGRDISGPLSPSVTDGDDEDDAFAGIEDLKDENTPVPGAGGSVAGMQSPVSMAAVGVGDVHEEFDLGPRFIQLQKDEETIWRKRCELWFPAHEPRHDGQAWRWAIREIVPPLPDNDDTL
ncbi:protein byr4-like [Teratosphaeria destructans]|uniref:Protein byr4-like n=1 Tax=Teratosphaeria destructans TaxID=418781 RepID=A0A9W7W762_9PEZI|nr:protein byr4-like [Teratosphaeria destructans]